MPFSIYIGKGYLHLYLYLRNTGLTYYNFLLKYQIILLKNSTTVIYKVPLKNSKKKVLLDYDVYEFLSENSYYVSIKLLENLREHSSGCCVFQKSWKRPDGQGYTIQTIYLHKLIAEKYIGEAPAKNFNVIAKNGNKLDCRIDNLEWRTKGYIARRSRPIGAVPYRGVSKDRKRFRAEIYNNGERIYLGTYKTAEEAAEAYKKKAVELFGEDVEISIRPTNTRVTGKN